MIRTHVAALALLLAPMRGTSATNFGSGPTPPAPRAAMRDTATCFDTLHAADSISAVVTMSVRPRDAKATLPPDFEGLFVQEVSSRLKAPRSLPLAVMVGWDRCDSAGHGCSEAVLTLGSTAYATAHPAGALTRIAVIDPSLTPTFADSVRAVLEKIGQEKMSPPFFNRKDSISLKISIDVVPHPDTIPVHRHLFRVTIPHYKLPFTYADWPKHAKGPKYPSIAESRRVGDSVAVMFTVLPDGTVDAQSVDVLSGHYFDFVKAVFDHLATAKFLPAHVGGCRVATRVGQSFGFKMP